MPKLMQPNLAKSNKTSTSFANQLNADSSRKDMKEKSERQDCGTIWQHLHNEAVDVDPRDRQENTLYVLRLLRAV